MPYQVSRTDTGQFVLMDPATDTVVIDDDLAQGFTKLEQAVADKPPLASAPAAASEGADPATQGSSAFAFRGGPRYTPILLAVVLPFAWLAVLYFALANLLSESALDRSATEETEAKVEALERDIQTLRSEIAGAPRTAKTKPTRPKPKKSTPQPAARPQPAAPANAADAADDDEAEPDDEASTTDSTKGPH